MKIKKLLETSDYKPLIDLWNHEFGFIYPISEELFYRNVVKSDDVLDEGSYTVVDDNDQVIGFIVTKVWNRPFPIPAYEDRAWISLIYVIPKERKKGIGTLLLNKAESEIKRLGKRTIQIGRDCENFFPGVPFDMKGSYKWFINRGYDAIGETNDLIRSVTNNLTLIPTKDIDYEVRFATRSDRDKIIKFMEKNFPGRWQYEVTDYFDAGGTGREYLIAIDNDNVIGFTRVNDQSTLDELINYNLTWRNRFSALGGIGPLGVDADYRKQNLGFHMVATAVNSLIERKVSDIIIDWTSLVDFYRKFGFEVWKSYKYFEKKEEK
ncbi:MAG TPA: GNAT family N-acetyltransferase [Acholeplasmataceae bacterium]|nr:GNAT family N-acetyltransferase [Acholeplasmataceae bacterium]